MRWNDENDGEGGYLPVILKYRDERCVFDKVESEKHVLLDSNLYIRCQSCFVMRA